MKKSIKFIFMRFFIIINIDNNGNVLSYLLRCGKTCIKHIELEWPKTA